MSRLTERQKAFADYYIESLNATESAIRSGYSEKTASEMGYENLNKPQIKAYIKQRLEEIESNRIATIEELMQFHSDVVNNNYRKLGYKQPLYLKDRLTSAEALLKRLDLASTLDNKKKEADIEFIKARTELLKGATVDMTLLKDLMGEKEKYNE